MTTRKRIVLVLVLGNLIGAAVNVLAAFTLDSSTWWLNVFAAVVCVATAWWLWWSE